ncbi:fibronectin type III domain-containing protein [candidate division KSB1 bacterium]
MSKTVFRSVTLLLIICTLFAWYCTSDDNESLVGPIDDKTAPSKPVRPSLTSVGNGEIVITWEANPESDVAGYNIYRTTGSDDINSYTNIADTTGTSYKDIGLEYTTSYFYRITAYDITLNESEKSEAVTGIPLNTLPPDSPVNVAAVGRNLIFPEIEITWDKNTESDIAGYKIYRGDVSTFAVDASSLIDSVSVNIFIDADVGLDTLYYYKITAFDKGGIQSIPSIAQSDAALSPVSLISPLNNITVSATPTFSWNSINHVFQYKVFIQTSTQGGEIWNKTVDNSETTVVYDGSTALESGRTYYWKVATITKDPLSLNSFSAIQSFKIQ